MPSITNINNSKHCYKLVLIGLILSLNTVSSQSLSKNDTDFKRKQDSILILEIENCFNTSKPVYNSEERRNAFYLIDAVTHNDFPHSNTLKELFLNRYKKTLESIKKTKIDSGIALWNIYNIAYIIKTPNSTIALDLTRLPSSLKIDGNDNTYNNLAKELVELCDVLFISHKHGDHADSFVAKEFLLQNKTVITHTGVFKEEDFYTQITHLPRNGKVTAFKVPNIDTELKIRIYPGHQAIAADTAIDNNFTVITFPNKITIAHSGDQSWATDFDWIDTLHKDVPIDILLVNTWTLLPDRLATGLNPKIILPSHINEMNHTISTRIPYWQSYQNWKNSGDKVIHLFWGESYYYNKK